MLFNISHLNLNFFSSFFQCLYAIFLFFLLSTSTSLFLARVLFSFPIIYSLCSAYLSIFVSTFLCPFLIKSYKSLSLSTPFKQFLFSLIQHLISCIFFFILYFPFFLLSLSLHLFSLFLV